MYSSHEHDTVEVAGAQYDTVTALGSTTNLMMPTESKSVQVSGVQHQSISSSINSHHSSVKHVRASGAQHRVMVMIVGHSPTSHEHTS